MEDFVILVDSNDQELGTMPKMEAHKKGELHRAFSIFVFNSQNELLIHQRAVGKYHSGGLWTNTCCSHPKPGETTEKAAVRRLKEEMGFVTEVHKLYFFEYKEILSNGLIENELDHVFIGTFDGEVVPDPDEVMDYRYMKLADLKLDVERNPQHYTEWFKICLPELQNKIDKWVA